MNPPSRMMLRLVLNVIEHERQCLLAKTYNAVTLLPGERASTGHLVVDVMRARTLDLSNPIRDVQGRGNIDGQMEVILNAANIVEHRVGRLDDAIPNVMDRRSLTAPSITRALPLVCQVMCR